MHDFQDTKDQVTAPHYEHRGGATHGRPPVEDTPGWWLQKIITRSRFHTSIRDAERNLNVPELSRAFHGQGVPASRLPALMEKLPMLFSDTWELFGRGLEDSLVKHRGFKTAGRQYKQKPRVKKETGARINAGRLIAAVTKGDFSMVMHDKQDGSLKDVATWQKIVAGSRSISARTYIDAIFTVRERYKLHVYGKEYYRTSREIVTQLWALNDSEKPAAPKRMSPTNMPSLLYTHRLR